MSLTLLHRSPQYCDSNFNFTFIAVVGFLRTRESMFESLDSYCTRSTHPLQIVDADAATYTLSPNTKLQEQGSSDSVEVQIYGALESPHSYT